MAPNLKGISWNTYATSLGWSSSQLLTAPNELVDTTVQWDPNRNNAPLPGWAVVGLGYFRAATHVPVQRPSQSFNRDGTLHFGIIKTFAWSIHSRSPINLMDWYKQRDHTIRFSIKPTPSLSCCAGETYKKLTALHAGIKIIMIVKLVPQPHSDVVTWYMLTAHWEL